ncbi:MAG: N-acetylmuramoyl-L-alanine amidase [Rhodocyclaceae bacterium]|nr:N-acetylmuramoyl-L-alanine amidase [Rhodocyclaceae bacterium]
MLSARRIDLIVIHCSATPNGRWVAPADIDAWHRERGFHRADEARRSYNPDLTAIGYHWLILPNGGRPSGRHPFEIGAHARDRRANHRGLGLCLIGTDRFSRPAWEALADQVQFLCDKYRVPRRFAQQSNDWTGVCGHRDLGAPKACPGFPVAEWLAGGLEPLAGHILESA